VADKKAVFIDVDNAAVPVVIPDATVDEVDI